MLILKLIAILIAMLIALLLFINSHSRFAKKRKKHSNRNSYVNSYVSSNVDGEMTIVITMLAAILILMLIAMLCANFIKLCGNCKKGSGLQHRGYKSHFIDLRPLQNCLPAVHGDSERTLNGLANTWDGKQLHKWLHQLKFDSARLWFYYLNIILNYSIFIISIFIIYNKNYIIFLTLY